MLELDEGHTARSERRSIVAALEHGEPEHPVVELGEAAEVAHREAERADMQRGTVCEGGRGGGVRGVHGQVYLPFGARAQYGLAASVPIPKFARVCGKL